MPVPNSDNKTIFTDELRLNYALMHEIFENIALGKTNYYFFLGITFPWEESESLNYPYEFDAAIHSDLEEIYENIVFMRKLDFNDISLLTNRYKWNSGLSFSHWDHTKPMNTSMFYCMNQTNDVYKCLFNNHGAPSTVEPTGKALDPFTTSDGYIWKYMYSVDDVIAEKFMTDDYLPVPIGGSLFFNQNGGIRDIKIINPGYGYSSDTLTKIREADPILGDFQCRDGIDGSPLFDESPCYYQDYITKTGYGATFTITSVNSEGAITGLEITESGQEYINNKDFPDKECGVIIFSTVYGKDALIKPIADSSGEMFSYAIINGGIGYQKNETAYAVSGGAELRPIISKHTGSIIDVEIVNPGGGYINPPILEVYEAASTAMEGTGLYGNSSAIVKAIIYDSKIVNVIIEDPGKNYSSANETYVIFEGDGSGALVSPVINKNGQIANIKVESAGEGYTWGRVTIVGDNETPCIAEPIIGDSFFNYASNQSIVEQFASPGQVYAIEVKTRGEGYTDSIQVIIDGDGTGATAEATVGSDGGIDKIDVLTYGKNYTWISVSFVDEDRYQSVDEEGMYEDAVAYGILPPYNGHGFDATKELFANRISIYSILGENSKNYYFGREYRQVGLIKDPKYVLGNINILDTELFTTFEIEISSATDTEISQLDHDDILIDTYNNKRYRIVQVSKEEKKIYLLQLSTIFTQDVKGPFRNLTKGDEFLYQVEDLLSIPIVNRYSGELLYSTNSRPFSVDLTDNVRRTLAYRSVLNFICENTSEIGTP